MCAVRFNDFPLCAFKKMSTYLIAKVERINYELSQWLFISNMDKNNCEGNPLIFYIIHFVIGIRALYLHSLSFCILHVFSPLK